jgi:hypothetical protein
MALLAYLRPTDPAHPVRFDVLTTEISVPLWLAITIVVSISAITIITMRRFQAKPKRDKRYSSTSTEAKTPAESLNLVPSSSLVKPTAPVPESARDVTATASSNERFRFDDSARMFSFTFAEGLAYEISSDHIGAGGATVALINNTPDYIGSYTVGVGEIVSWNEMHQTFLPPYRFARKPVLSGQNLEPIHKTNGQWLIRVVERNGTRYLTVFNNDSTPLSWPNNDKSTVEIWRLMLAGAYSVKPVGLQGPWQPLPAAYVLVRWDRESGSFSITKHEPKVPEKETAI